MKIRIIFVSLQFLVVVVIFHPVSGFAQAQNVPYYLRDRGNGIPMSQFGTYVNKGEVLIYPFYEYYYDKNLEYEPADFGYGSTKEMRGSYKAHEGLMFLGYGISERLALEFEAGIISAELSKSPEDTTAMPAKLKDSGLNDVEGQIRWRWNYESESTPEFFNYFETVFPTGEKNSLIGTSVWEFKLGIGLVKGFRWGTMTLRAAADYDTGEKNVAPGEYALEYLKRVSDKIRLFAMVEGADDEVAIIPEIQWHVSPHVFLKANTGFGITSKATDFAPEVGILFSFFP